MSEGKGQGQGNGKFSNIAYTESNLVILYPSLVKR